LRSQPFQQAGVRLFLQGIIELPDPRSIRWIKKRVGSITDELCGDTKNENMRQIKLK